MICVRPVNNAEFRVGDKVVLAEDRMIKNSSNLSWPARCLTWIEFRPRAGPTFRGLGDCPDVQAQTGTEAGAPH